jgi:hypothetical protein
MVVPVKIQLHAVRVKQGLQSVYQLLRIVVVPVPEGREKERKKEGAAGGGTGSATEVSFLFFFPSLPRKKLFYKHICTIEKKEKSTMVLSRRGFFLHSRIQGVVPDHDFPLRARAEEPSLQFLFDSVRGLDGEAAGERGPGCVVVGRDKGVGVDEEKVEEGAARGQLAVAL